MPLGYKISLGPLERLKHHSWGRSGVGEYTENCRSHLVLAGNSPIDLKARSTAAMAEPTGGGGSALPRFCHPGNGQLGLL